MHLTAEEEAILNGEEGETKQQLLEILVGVGKVFGAEEMVPIRSAQVSGASYKTIGEWGLKWLASLDAHAAVPAVLNPVGMDRIRWEEMGIDPGFAKKQLEVISAYERLGIRLECTCTPYYLNITEYGDHLAWSEVLSGQLCKLGHWCQNQPGGGSFSSCSSDNWKNPKIRTSPSGEQKARDSYSG
jgi:predicted aconitase